MGHSEEPQGLGTDFEEVDLEVDLEGGDVVEVEDDFGALLLDLINGPEPVTQEAVERLKAAKLTQ